MCEPSTEYNSDWNTVVAEHDWAWCVGGGGGSAESKPPLLQRKGLLEAAQQSLASDH